jgi:hypothetical protein
MAERPKKIHVREEVGQNVPDPRAASAMPHVITRIIEVRMAVAAFESIPETPIFAKMAVRAAKTADANDQ